jgi:hypothetical protein
VEWLQLVYRVPAEPSRMRTHIWRLVRGLGAFYLQDGCCVLPRTSAAESGLADVAAKVRDYGGEATLSWLGPAEPGWEERLVAALNQARDEEYQELIDTIERFEEEIARETRKRKFTFAAFEEVGDEFERLQRWLAKIRARDVCHAQLAGSVAKKLDGARGALEVFADQVHQRAGGTGSLPGDHADEGAIDVSQFTPSNADKSGGPV